MEDIPVSHVKNLQFHEKKFLTVDILLIYLRLRIKKSQSGTECSCPISGVISTKLKMYRTDLSQHFFPSFTKVIHIICHWICLLCFESTVFVVKS